jgi:hypothetical protein
MRRVRAEVYPSYGLPERAAIDMSKRRIRMMKKQFMTLQIIHLPIMKVHVEATTALRVATRSTKI